MRTIVMALGCCLVNLATGQAHGQAAAESVKPLKQNVYALVAAVGTFARVFESLREALGGRLITAADAEALGPKLKAALRGNELVLLKASRGVALERVLNYLT